MAYTPHGHWIPGTEKLPVEESPLQFPCKGVSLCYLCENAVEEYWVKKKEESVVDEGPKKHDDEEFTGKDAENILKIVYECMYQSGSIMYPEELQDRLNDAGYGMKKPEIRPHYRK